ncbi:PBP1A family penicillin-binding protein [Paenibacillus cymbidii]|uniref:PBP1A family penicillin-binding protein n=1 Tax=Paenibacillus cymbidii TaxID=1639034 RepID=UPI001081B911|nr:PBP1A family penicillin-binding protein [Paenibacillus cymbidii]
MAKQSEHQGSPSSSGKNGSKSTAGKKRKRKWKPARIVMWSLAVVAVGVICALAGYMFILFNGEKQYNASVDKLEMTESTKFYGLDLNNKPVEVATRASGQNRELVDFKEIPPLLADAFIATEDKRFAEHSGVDFISIGRALVKDVINRSAVEGGSTITQQLAKNMFLNADKTLFRKATEVSIAIALENHNTKDEILEMYLNRIYFGQSVWGIKAAAKLYFGKSNLNDLKLWEMATLAGIPKAPSVYNPITNAEKSKDRRATVLMLMNQQGYITDAERAEAEAVEYVAPVRTDSKKNYLTFLDYAAGEAAQALNIDEDQLLREGYNVYMTMNPDAQLAMEQSYENDALFQKDTDPQQKIQSSMVILDHRNGNIVAMIGGRDYVNKGLNRVDVRRQPGSSFKPIVVYAPAIEKKGFTPYSMLEDKQATYGYYSPRNYDGVYQGQVTMFEAVRKSINAPAVSLLNTIKVGTGMDFAEKLGITFERPQDENLAIALGGMTKGASPLEMAKAYSAFANNGQQYEPHALLRITDKDGKEVWATKDTKPKQVMSAKTAWYVNLLLQGVVDSGTGTGAKMNRPVAGKTGTTQLDLKGLEKYNRDVWFVGFTPEWTAAVWEGFDKTDAKHYVTSSGGPDKIFKDVMTKAMAKMPVKPFVKPSGVDDLKQAPDKITDLQATYVPENRKVELTWTSMGGGSLYQVYRKGSKDEDYKQLIIVQTNQLNDITIVPGEKYEYYVVVEKPDSDGVSDKSNTATVEIPPDGTGSPSPSGSGTPTPSPSGSVSPTPGGSGSPSPGGSGKPGGTATPTPTQKPSGGGNGTQSPGKTPTPTPSPSNSPAGGQSKPPAGNNGNNGNQR